MICHKCGSEMQQFTEGSTLILRCPNCGFSITTTYINPIYEDKTVYSVIVTDNNAITNANVKAISHIMNSNYINARKILSASPFKLCDGQAPFILSVKTQLDETQINYEITREFNY